MAAAPAGRLAALRHREPARVAWAKLAAPLKEQQGIRVFMLGITGAGKTTSMKDFIGYLQGEELVDLVLVHDVKLREQQYDGAPIYDAREVLDHPPEKYPAVRVLRRRAVDHLPSLDEAARVTNQISYDGIPTILVADEFKRALTANRLQFQAPNVQILLSEGRALGGSLLYTDQLPYVPQEAMDQSQIVLHRLGRKGLGYLVERHVLDERGAELVAGLRTGEFVLVSTEEDFDGVIYQTPPPKRRTHVTQEGSDEAERASA